MHSLHIWKKNSEIKIILPFKKLLHYLLNDPYVFVYT